MKCPYCQSDKVTKMGFNRTFKKVDGHYEINLNKQRFVCSDCHHTTQKPILDS